MNTEDSEFARIEREQKMRAVPDPIHHTDPGETLEYISGWNDCRAVMLEQPAQRKPLNVAEVEQILAQHNYEIHGDRARYIVRMTEAAHGIKENT